MSTSVRTHTRAGPVVSTHLPVNTTAVTENNWLASSRPSLGVLVSGPRPLSVNHLNYIYLVHNLHFRPLPGSFPTNQATSTPIGLEN